MSNVTKITTNIFVLNPLKILLLKTSKERYLWHNIGMDPEHKNSNFIFQWLNSGLKYFGIPIF